MKAGKSATGFQQRHFDGSTVSLADTLAVQNGGEGCRVVVLRIEPILNGVDDIIGRKRLAVVPGHPSRRVIVHPVASAFGSADSAGAGRSPSGPNSYSGSYRFGTRAVPGRSIVCQGLIDTADPEE